MKAQLGIGGLLSLACLGLSVTGLGLPEAIALAQTAEGQREEAIRLNQAGEELRLQGKWQEALETFERALGIFRQVGDRPGQATSLDGIGDVYAGLKESEKALDFYQQALVIRRELGDRPGLAKVLNRQGFVYDFLNDHQKGLEFYQQAQLIYQETGNRTGLARVLINQGGTYHSLNDHQKALEFYQQAQSIFEEMGDRLGLAYVLMRQGGFYHSLSDYGKALEFYQQAQPIFEETGDRNGLARVLNSQGFTYDFLNDHQKALEFYQQAQLIYEETGDRLGLAYVLMHQGNVYRSLSDNQKALEFYRQAQPIFEETGNRRGLSYLLTNQGATYHSLSEYRKALEFYQQAQSIFEEIGDRNGLAKILMSQGRVYHSLSDYGKALEFYQQAQPIFVDVGDRNSLGSLLGRLGYLFEQQDEPQLAILYLKQAVNTYETIRQDIKPLNLDLQQTYTNSISDTYRTLADLLLQQDRILEAQQVLDLLKVQELEEYLKNTRGTTNDPLIILKPEQEILDRYNELQKTAIQIGQELTQLRHLKTQHPLSPQQENRLAQLVALEKDLNHQFNTFIDSDPIQTLLNQLSRRTSQPIVPLEDLNNLRDNLRNTKAVLISPLILPDRLELIITTPNSPPLRRTVTHFDAQKLRETVTQYRSALQSPHNIEETKRLAQQLYTWLLKPLEADLAAANPDTLIYAPDGILRYIPLAALYDGNQWIAERYRTNNIVAQSLTELDTAPQTAPRILAGAWGNQSRSIQVGNQDFRFSGIPFTLNEVDSLAQLFPTKVLREQTFDRKNLMPELNNFSIIHLATHGKFVVGDANNSFLALGSGETIPLPEIKDLTMTDVELVVLSACETGIGGSFGEGEEILGLGYQFQRAGAKAALASLWQVDDGGTQLLMDAFYAALQKGMTKAQALQEAQKALISSNYTTVGLKRAGIEVVSTKTGSAMTDEQLSNPYYWAPFILIGNGL